MWCLGGRIVRVSNRQQPKIRQTPLIPRKHTQQQTSNLTAGDAVTFLWGGAEGMDEAARAKWRNLLTLVAAGVYATVLLVTVDMESWRGWTLSEIVWRIPCACVVGYWGCFGWGEVVWRIPCAWIVGCWTV